MSRSRPPGWLAGLGGLVAAAAGLGAGELVAAFGRSLRSPVVSVGDGVIALVPPAVKDFAVAVFGTGDKLALITGILVLLAGFAAGLGVLAFRNMTLAMVGVAALGAVAALAVLLAEDAGVMGLTPTLATVVVTAAGLRGLVWVARRDRPAGETDYDRRAVLQMAGGLAAGAIIAAVAGRVLSQRFSVNASREELVLPEPVRSLDLPIPAAADLDVEGLIPFITPNENFYRIDTALVVPRIDPTQHRIRVTGLVEQELDIPFPALLEREMIEIPITLACVSNEVGGDLIDTAVWRGFRLRELLDEAGVRDEATQIVGRSVDGFTVGMPVEAAYDRDTLVAVGMNGEPLPLEHGFPVRLVTPGLYGYVSATKWLAEIELTTFEDFEAYWIPRGWAVEAPIKTQSKILVPRPLATVPAGRVAVAGVAWAQGRGIEKVEVRIDDGDWQEAELAAPVNDVTWRQWKLAWEAAPGRHSLTVRATDRTGQTQTEERQDPRPDGATGWHQIPVNVE